MRNRSQKGFTLIELLIVIAIIGILAAVLIPNLLAARERAFDTAAQTCLKEIGVLEELAASVDPWEYDNGFETNTITSCDSVTVEELAGVTANENFGYSAEHDNGSREFYIRDGAGVTAIAPTF